MAEKAFSTAAKKLKQLQDEIEADRMKQKLIVSY